MLRAGLAAAIVITSAAAAGVPETVRIRSVVIDGVQGTGYYSVVEQGFRMVGGLGVAPRNADDSEPSGSQPGAGWPGDVRTASVDERAVISADDLAQSVPTRSSIDTGDN